MKVPFFRADIGEKEKSIVANIMESKKRDNVKKLEKEFAKYIGVSKAVACSSGTAALHLAMLAINLKRGDKILCSVNSHPSIAEVVRHFDAEPIFIDVEEDSYNINLNHLEDYLSDNKSRKLKAVIVSHVGGQSVDLERLYNIAKIYNVKIVEEAHEAFGATYNGKKIGSLEADITCFNFTPHLKECIYNGGMIVSNDEELIERASLLRNHAMTYENSDLGYVYNVVDLGQEYLMSEIDAGIILAQLEKQDRAVLRQQEIAKIYLEKLKDAQHITLPPHVKNNSFSLFIIKVNKNRDSFARELLENGIHTGLHYKPMHLLTYYKNKYNFRINDFPVALKNYGQILSIPIYSAMSDKEVKFVCDTILEITKTRV
ncbi:MAG: DegT/DnrJ/EryC1/StrS aminotransferase family protein [Campylobacterota bacterium]|nr:DegT/DnrJ/EryC1/StrS aminotransferase family protein [Campylobacterota bacterium]